MALHYNPPARSVIVSQFLEFMNVCGGHPAANPVAPAVQCVGGRRGMCGGAAPLSRLVKDSLFRSAKAHHFGSWGYISSFKEHVDGETVRQ